MVIASSCRETERFTASPSAVAPITLNTSPRFEPLGQTGTLTVLDVIRARPGEDRDRVLREWGKSVWDAWGKEHARIESLVERLLW